MAYSQWAPSKCCCPPDPELRYAFVRRMGGINPGYEWVYDSGNNFNPIGTAVIAGRADGSCFYVDGGGRICRLNYAGVRIRETRLPEYTWTPANFSLGRPGITYIAWNESQGALYVGASCPTVGSFFFDELYDYVPTLFRLDEDLNIIWSSKSLRTNIQYINPETLQVAGINRTWGEGITFNTVSGGPFPVRGSHSVWQQFEEGTGDKIGDDIPMYDNPVCTWCDDTGFYLGGLMGSGISTGGGFPTSFYGAVFGVQYNNPPTIPVNALVGGSFTLSWNGFTTGPIRLRYVQIGTDNGFSNGNPIYGWQPEPNLDVAFQTGVPGLDYVALGGGKVQYLPGTLNFNTEDFVNLETTPKITVTSSLAAGTLVVTPLTDSGNPRYSVKKLDTDGSLLWKTRHGANILSITADDSQNVYITGQRAQAVNLPNPFGGFFTDWGPYPQATDEMNLRKLDSSGAIEWSDQLCPSMTSDFGMCVALDPSQNPIFGGAADAAWTNPLTKPIFTQPQLVRFDPAGTRTWDFVHGHVIRKISSPSDEFFYISGGRGRVDADY